MGARLGRWSAFTVCVIGVAYMAALASGFAIYGLAAPIVDPLLAVMEVLTLVSALFLLVMMARSMTTRPQPARSMARSRSR